MIPTSEPAARPGWVTWAGLGVVGAAAAVLSFASVRDLAAAASYPAGLAWLLPVVIDTTAVVGSRIWLGGRGQPAAASYARTLALTAAGVTITGNVIQHALTAYQLAPAWWLIAALAAVPPAALVAVAHLVALLTRAAAPVASRAGQEPAEALVGPGHHPLLAAVLPGRSTDPQDPPGPATVAVDSEDQADAAGAGWRAADDPRVRELAELLAAGAQVTGEQAAAMHGCSARTGRRLLGQARRAAASRGTCRPVLHLIGTRDRNGAS